MYDEIATTLNFRRELPTKLFIHGFRTDITSSWYTLLKNAYFDKGDCNIIYVDWSKASNRSYRVSSANVKPVGEFIGDFLIECKLKFNNIHVIGHSLGSMVAGFVGKHIYNKTGRKIHRITGTDPAAPGFEKSPSDFRLSSGDAEFVDVIHTDIGHFGITSAIGDVDYYPNGGHSQPGCPPLDVDGTTFCSKLNLIELFVKFVKFKN